MKRTLTATAGVLLCLLPSTAAHAGDTGQGRAYGNCGNSSAGGVHAPLTGGAGKGNGGHQGAVCPGAAPVVSPVLGPPTGLEPEIN